MDGRFLQQVTSDKLHLDFYTKDEGNDFAKLAMYVRMRLDVLFKYYHYKQ